MMHPLFEQPITQVIELRHSVRNYSNQPLSDTLIQKIESFIAAADNPFEQKVKIKLIRKSSEDAHLKLGTYGVITGADYFLVTACHNDDLSRLSLGYQLEKVILYCTSLGLGTVWLGGTFNKSHFAKTMHLTDQESLPIVSPVGYEGGKKSLLASVFSRHSKQRKSYSELFFNQNFDTPLTADEKNPFYEPLEMLRLAPSAVNMQPWRTLKTDDTIHFYITKTKGFPYIDLGIALCHFHLTAIESGLSGKFTILPSEKVPHHASFTYVISWVSNSTQ